MAPSILRRQGFPDETGYTGGGWWFSTTGVIIRYVITAAIIITLILLIGGGYAHAKRRLKQGKEPLAYHRWLISNATRQRYGMQPVYPAGYVPPRFNSAPTEQFSLNTWNGPPPPPAYNPEAQSPPPEYYHHQSAASPYGKVQPHATMYSAHPMSGPAFSSSAPAPSYEYVPPAGPPPQQLGSVYR